MNKQQFTDYRLSDEITRALGIMKYESPTEVQQQVIPRALKREDLIVKAQTGSGKTAAFGIPVIELIDWAENKPQVLVLTPTRELAVQVREDMTNIGRFKRIKATAVYGKEPFSKQREELKQKTHIVVGTPGRVMDHIERETLSLDRVEYLIIDEADEMLNRGFLADVEKILQQLPKDRVTMVFSATFPQDIERLCQKHMNAPARVAIESTGMTASTIEHR
ncbi:MAG: DEAD/DEAH box helicase, partial [Exiguobacterium sp.]|nr:DEAD/DEAH box helicase [Exiguobacterium sp.]